MIPVTAAVIEQGDRYLLARRKPGKTLAGTWEFPGGKVEAGEDAAACLVREIREEMNLEIEVGELLGVTEHQYDFARIRLIVFRALILGGDMRLTDHDEAGWFTPQEICRLDLAPADVPIVEWLDR
jgi:8-oxo-dGTP diphosphatase